MLGNGSIDKYAARVSTDFFEIPHIVDTAVLSFGCRENVRKITFKIKRRRYTTDYVKECNAWFMVFMVP